MEKYKMNDIVMVCWEDSASKDSWGNTNAYIKPEEITSVGFVIHVAAKLEEFITIAQSVDELEGVCAGQLTIPFTAVFQLKVLNKILKPEDVE